MSVNHLSPTNLQPAATPIIEDLDQEIAIKANKINKLIKYAIKITQLGDEGTPHLHGLTTAARTVVEITAKENEVLQNGTFDDFLAIGEEPTPTRSSSAEKMSKLEDEQAPNLQGSTTSARTVVEITTKEKEVRPSSIVEKLPRTPEEPTPTRSGVWKTLYGIWLRNPLKMLFGTNLVTVLVMLLIFQRQSLMKRLHFILARTGILKPLIIPLIKTDLFSAKQALA